MVKERFLIRIVWERRTVPGTGGLRGPSGLGFPVTKGLNCGHKYDICSYTERIDRRQYPLDHVKPVSHYLDYTTHSALGLNSFINSVLFFFVVLCVHKCFVCMCICTLKAVLC